MAFTKTPLQSTHQIEDILFTESVHDSYESTLGVSKFVNMVPVVSPNKGESPNVYLQSSVGSTEIPASYFVNSSPITVIKTLYSPSKRLYAILYAKTVANYDFYIDFVTEDFLFYTFVLGSENAQLSTPFSSITLGETPKGWVVYWAESATNRFQSLEINYTPLSSVFSTTRSSYLLPDTFGLFSLGGYTTPICLNNTIYLALDSYNGLHGLRQHWNKVYNTAVGSFTNWDGASTDFIIPQINDDLVVELAKHHNHLVVFKQNSIEFFRDTANPVGSPLSRVEEYCQYVGVPPNWVGGLTPTEPRGNRNYYTTIGDDIYFLGKDQTSKVSVYRLSNFKVQKISPEWIDRLIVQSGLGPVIYNNRTSYRINAYEHAGMSYISFGILNDGDVKKQTHFSYCVHSDSWMLGPWGSSLSGIDTSYMLFTGQFLFTQENNSTDNRLAVSYKIEKSYKTNTTGQFVQPSHYEYTSNTIDFGTRNRKHIEYIDIDFEYLQPVDVSEPQLTNTIYGTLFVKLEKDDGRVINRTIQLKAKRQLIREYNWGDCRSFWITITRFQGAPSSFRIHGIHVAYNLGTEG